MPTTQEINQFRRLIGDYNTHAVAEIEIKTYLDDATAEVTADFVKVATTSPVLDSPEFNQFANFTTVSPAIVKTFDELFVQFHPEVIYKAAINYWWNKAASLADKLSTTVGQASQNVEKKWDHAMAMIATLEEHYKGIQQLGLDITIGNLSIFDRRYLQRRGGQREENALTQQEGAQPGDLWYG